MYLIIIITKTLPCRLISMRLFLFMCYGVMDRFIAFDENALEHLNTNFKYGCSLEARALVLGTRWRPFESDYPYEYYSVRGFMY